VQLQEGPSGRQAQSGTLAPTSVAAPSEGRQRRGDLLLTHAVATVAHAYRDAAVLQPAALYPNRTAPRREADGIADQACEHLAQLARVPLDARQVLVEVALECDACLKGGRPQRFRRAPPPGYRA